MTLSPLRLLVGLSLAQAAMAQTIWGQTSASLPPRANHSMAYDMLRANVVLFGGGGVGGTSDTWEWNGTTWALASVAGPPARNGSAMVYDTLHLRTLLFGGVSPQFQFFGDTWEWNGVTWLQRVTSSGPGIRVGHAMAFDGARGRVVMFGGLGSLGSETWEWDGNAWTLVSSSGPSWRAYHAMAFDSARARTVLFGGSISGVPLGDTWEWDGTNWALLATTGPTARSSHAMAYDSVRGRTVLFGGSGNAGGAVYFGDTWEWDGIAWAAAPSGPPARAWHGMAHDSAGARMVMFGGSGPAAALGDTWVYVPSSPATATQFGNGCGNPALALSPDVSAPPTIGTTAKALLTNLPSPLVFMAIGSSNTTAGAIPLPIPLDAYGMIGCFLNQSAEVIGLGTSSTAPGIATYALPLPLMATLIGQHSYLQGYAFAPSMNPANIILSNGLDWHIGY